MRIYADINRFLTAGAEPASVIIQVAPTPPVGAPAVPVNGKFYVEIPEGVNPPVVTPFSLLGGVAPNLVSEIFDNLLARFPKYSNVAYNPLLQTADTALLDTAATFPGASLTPPVAGSLITRAQVGPAPNGVAILPQNGAVTPARPGVLITDTITLPTPKSEFLVYWKIHEYAVTDDVMDYDGGSNVNAPAIKGLLEVNQTPPDFTVYLSTNGGAGYSPVGRLTPCAVCDPGDQIRLAFVNTSTTAKRYLASYAILY